MYAGDKKFSTGVFFFFQIFNDHIASEEEARKENRCRTCIFDDTHKNETQIPEQINEEKKTTKSLKL